MPRRHLDSCRAAWLTVFGEKNDPLGFQRQWAERFADNLQLEIRAGNHFPMCDDSQLLAKAVNERFGTE